MGVGGGRWGPVLQAYVTIQLREEEQLRIISRLHQVGTKGGWQGGRRVLLVGVGGGKGLEEGWFSVWGVGGWGGIQSSPLSPSN